MRRSSTSIALLLSSLLLISICAAQTSITAVPNLIRYGGTLKDAQGAALSSSTAVGVTFALYKQQDGGAPVWMETQNVTPDANGQYNVILGSTTTTGLPDDLFSQQGQRWLGVQVEGQDEQARVLLVSVPYAFKAHEAETLGGRSISDFVLAKDLNATNSATGTTSNFGSSSTPAASGNDNKSPSKLQPSMGQTFFSSALTPVVSVMQTGTTPGNNAILATNSNLTSTSNAVTGQISGAGRAIYGQALSTSAQAYGVQGDTASTNGVGLLGFATASTGSTYGLKGYSSSTSGTGVRGLSTATTGTTYGVSGAVSSPNGTAMWGQATASTGGTGVWGQSQATTGAATGVLATAASTAGTGIVATESATSGTTYGLNAKVQSLAGTATWLQNTAGGPLILATTGPSTSPVTQFSVDGSGNVKFGGNLATLSIGSAADDNLFLGVEAGFNNVAGSGQANTFSGYQAGYNNTTGAGNIFAGYQAGYSNSTGNDNTFNGPLAGYSNSTGEKNTFTGALAGYGNTTGNRNTFIGNNVGASNTTGFSNTFIGDNSGPANTTGQDNTFVGRLAGLVNTTGNYNTFVGVTSGWSNSTGEYNTYFGYQAGYSNTTGEDNIFIGSFAGNRNTTGIQDIYIGNTGALGSTAESNVIRIGSDLQGATFIAGIYGATSSSGVPVYINSDGLLGTLTSSRRFKEQVRDMGDSSSKLFQLRPVTFFYKPQYDDGSHTLQYGLIAEEVAEVYPDMVAYDKDGQPYTVKYQYLAPMLLNELQKQHTVVAAQEDVIKGQQGQLQTQGEQIAGLQQRLSRLESLIAKK